MERAARARARGRAVLRALAHAHTPSLVAKRKNAMPEAGSTEPSTSTFIDDVSISAESDYTAIATKQTTGGHVWDAARHLLRFLEGRPELLASTRSVLELGAGTGWLGMTLARNVPTLQRVCLTEMLDGGAFAWLQHNVAQNAALPLGAVETLPCDWLWFGESAPDECSGDAAPVAHARAALLSSRFDMVLGSDLVYDEVGMRALVQVFGALAESRDVKIFYAHTRYRFEMLDRDMLEALDARGLECVQVDPAVEERPDSPPPMSELFPEMFVVVYEIRLQ